MAHHGGPAVLRGGEALDVRLPDDLRSALREWAEVADAVLRSGDDQEVDLLRRRGRQLASRVADSLGRTVEFVDPVSGAVETIRAARPRHGLPRHGVPGSSAPGNGGPGSDVSGDGLPRHAARANGSTAHVLGTGRLSTALPAVAKPVVTTRPSDGAPSSPALFAPEPPGPTPWGTGAVVATFFAVLVALADIVLARAFAGAFGLLWVPANLLVTCGTMPSLWLARDVPFWRWPAFGAAAGLAAAWIGMLLELLGA